jgi:hypothetical protein
MVSTTPPPSQFHPGWVGRRPVANKIASEGDAVSKACIGTSDTSQNYHLKTMNLVQEFILQQDRDLK